MMDRNDVVTLWLPAAEKLTPVWTTNDQDGLFLNHHLTGKALDTALNVNEFMSYCDRAKSQDRPMPNGPLKDLLKVLVGPHAKAILRAYQIKHGIKT